MHCNIQGLSRVLFPPTQSVAGAVASSQSTPDNQPGLDLALLALNTPSSRATASKDSDEIERIPSPVRTITFDDNLAVSKEKDKKKKGFFSKSIFKKFGR